MVALLLMACSVLTGHEIDESIKLCHDHGGVYGVLINGITKTQTLRCQDGLMIDIDSIPPEGNQHAD